MALRESRDRPMGAETAKDGKCNGSITGTGPDFPDVPKRYCMNPPVPGRTRCKFHGGSVPKGLDHYAVRRKLSSDPGYYSTSLPVRMVNRFEEFIDAVDQGSVKGELALLRTFLAEHLQSLSEGGSIHAWDDVQEVINDLRSEKTTHQEAAEKLEGARMEARHEDSTINKIMAQIRLITSAADTENKREFMREKAVSAEKFALTMAVLAAMIKRHVEDDEVTVAIFKELEAIMTDTGKVRMIETASTEEEPTDE